MNERVKAVLLAGLLLFSGWSVYTRYVDLHAFDLVTQMPFRDLSMSQYTTRSPASASFPTSGASSPSGWCAPGRWLRRSILT